MILSDENHFFHQGQKSQYVCLSSGKNLSESDIDQTVKHPKQKTFCGCFCYTNMGSFYPVDGMKESAQYMNALEKKLIPDMPKAFPDGSGVFQQDLQLVHLL